MKLIHINESQGNRLFEAYQEGFSFDMLSRLKNVTLSDWRQQYEYCVKWLGEPTSSGSSRCVFTLSDNIVLKLAFGRWRKAGIAQNRLEYEMFNRYKSPLLATVYDADRDFTYLVSESVVPARDVDFEKILGIPFHGHYHQKSFKEPAMRHYDADDDFDEEAYNGMEKSDYTVGYNKYFDDIKEYGESAEFSLYSILSYIESNYVFHENTFYKEYEDVINNSEWLSNLRDFVEKSEISDFCHIGNFGIVNRDGNPTLVLLDSGMNLKLWDRHYGS